MLLFERLTIFISRFLLFALTLFFAAVSLGANFEISAPDQWKEVETSEDKNISIYENTQSKTGEMIVIQSVILEHQDPEFQDTLETNIRDLTDARAFLTDSIGLLDYNIVKVQKKELKGSKFSFYHSIQSHFLDYDENSVQMIERQFVNKNEMLIVTYLTTESSIKSYAEVDKIFDFFKPIYRITRVPASEAIRANGSSAKSSDAKSKAKYSEPDVPQGIDLDMKTEANKKLCEGVPASKRRGPNDPSYAAWLKTGATSAGSCFVGLIDGVVKMAVGIKDLVVSAGKYVAKKTYRDQVNGMVGVVASQIRKSPKQFAERTALLLKNEVVKFSGTYYNCLKPEEQARIACAVGSSLLAGGLLVKLIAKVPLGVAGVAKLKSAVHLANAKAGVAKVTLKTAATSSKVASKAAVVASKSSTVVPKAAAVAAKSSKVSSKMTYKAVSKGPYLKMTPASKVVTKTVGSKAAVAADAGRFADPSINAVTGKPMSAGGTAAKTAKPSMVKKEAVFDPYADHSINAVDGTTMSETYAKAAKATTPKPYKSDYGSDVRAMGDAVRKDPRALADPSINAVTGKPMSAGGGYPDPSINAVTGKPMSAGGGYPDPSINAVTGKPMSAGGAGSKAAKAADNVWDPNQNAFGIDATTGKYLTNEGASNASAVFKSDAKLLKDAIRKHPGGGYPDPSINAVTGKPMSSGGAATGVPDPYANPGINAVTGGTYP